MDTVSRMPINFKSHEGNLATPMFAYPILVWPLSQLCGVGRPRLTRSSRLPWKIFYTNIMGHSTSEKLLVLRTNESHNIVKTNSTSGTKISCGSQEINADMKSGWLSLFDYSRAMDLGCSIFTIESATHLSISSKVGSNIICLAPAINRRP